MSLDFTPVPTVLKSEVIRRWSLGGVDRPVKAVAATGGAPSYVGGYITHEKAIKGRTPAQIESILGLIPGTLGSGAFIMSLAQLPNADEFELASYTNQPGGTPFVPGGPYPPGQAVAQWRLTADLPAIVIKFVPPGTTF